jgi:trimeric autotransporter adhesin
MSHGISGLAFLTWSKNMSTGGSDLTYASSFGPTLQYPGDNPITIDQQNPALIFGTSFSFQLPVGKGRPFMNQAPAVVDTILGEWTVSGSLRYTSGNAMQINAFNFFAGTLGYSTLAPYEYANYVGGKVHGTWSGKFNPKTDKYLNPSAFAAPAAFTLGNLMAFNSWIRGFTQGSEALSIQKTVPIHDKLNFDVGADFVNPFNIVRWANPAAVAGTPTFGVVTATQGTPRQIQINGKLRF